MTINCSSNPITINSSYLVFFISCKSTFSVFHSKELNLANAFCRRLSITKKVNLLPLRYLLMLAFPNTTQNQQTLKHLNFWCNVEGEEIVEIVGDSLCCNFEFFPDFFGVFNKKWGFGPLHFSFERKTKKLDKYVSMYAFYSISSG